MFRKFCFLFISVMMLFSLVDPLFVEAAVLSNASEISAFIEEFMEAHGLPGASVVIVKRDEGIVYEAGFGQDANGVTLTENSLMRIASGSKPFTAFAVLQLVDRGAIELDGLVATYLPDISMVDARWEQVTVRQLLSHTSGLPNPTIVPPANTLQERIDSLKNWEFQSEPGKTYAYSNANFWVAAYLVERISDMTFSEYLDQNVFQPLGMTQTIAAVTTEDVIDGLANGHVMAYGRPLQWTELTQLFVGSGGIVTTASDMGQWLLMHLNNGKNENGESLLSKEWLMESYAPQVESKKNGLGWALSSPHVSPARVSHSGTLTTFESQQDIVFSRGYAVAVMLNSFTTTQKQAYEISSGIIQLMEGETPEIGTSFPTLIDLTIGAFTVIYSLLGIKGVIHSKKWSVKRRNKPAWKFYLQLIPQGGLVLAIGWLFFIVPTLQNNSSTLKDAFGLWPAAMILLASMFMIGLSLVIMRVFHRFKRRM